MIKGILSLTIWSVVIAADSCTGKATEAACTGVGCVWKNGSKVCSGSPARCDGTPICTGAGESFCGSNYGCTWIPTSDAICYGTATCSGQTTEEGCGALTPECTWEEADDDSCVGSPKTCGTTEPNCKLDGCTWTSAEIPASCEGEENSDIWCYHASNEGSCSEIGSSCEWNDAEAAKCHFQFGDEMECADFDRYENMGPAYCDATPGCEFSGNLGTCNGATPLTCASAGTSHDACRHIGCELGSVIECVAITCEDLEYEDECIAITGCEWGDENGNWECSGTPPPSSSTCPSKTTSEACENTEGCRANQIYECVVPECWSLPDTDCSGVSGCTWDSNTYQCSGTPTVPAETCTGKTDDICRNAGCTYQPITWCVGTPSITTCNGIGLGGVLCDDVAGCTSAGVSAGSCGGTISIDAATSATNRGDCEAFGMSFYWSDGYSEYCSGSTDSAKKCSDFTSSGKSICRSMHDINDGKSICKWNDPVSVGCSGTPTNTGANDCASLTSEGEVTCTGNKCTWVSSGESICTGTATSTCEDQTDLGLEGCEAVGGCTYEEEVLTASCSGINDGECDGGTSSSCTGVNGCTYTPGCAAYGTESACGGGVGCTWAQTGSCSEDKEKDNSAAIIYVPALLVLFFALIM